MNREEIMVEFLEIAAILLRAGSEIDSLSEKQIKRIIDSIRERLEVIL